MNGDERYVLHPSFAALWWQLEIPRTDAAREILIALRQQEFTAVAAEDFVLHVLRVLARVYAGAPMAPAARRDLVSDVFAVFTELTRTSAIRFAPRYGLAASSFAAALEHNIDFDDAQAVVLAVSLNIPLLVSSADPVFRNKLIAVAQHNPVLHLGWV